MTGILSRFLRSCRGGTAAEFALVLPVLLLFLFGIVEVGRLMWTWNKAEKATQMGVRYAVVTEPVPTGMVGYSFLGTGGLTQGDVIPASSYGAMQCTKSGSASATCSCVSGDCPWGTDADDAVFTGIYDRMHRIMPELEPGNIMVEYRPSGLGYAGNPDPDSPEIAPIVTVGLRNVSYDPMLLSMFGITGITLPGNFFQASLTMEDASGEMSN